MIKYFFVFLFCSISLLAQNGFFVKFKSSVEPQSINKTINSVVEQTLLKTNKPLKNKSLKQIIKPLNQYFYEKGEEIGKIFFVNFEDSELNNLAKDDLSSISEIEYTQQNQTFKVDVVPNDSLINEQWYLNKLNTFYAWQVTSGKKEIKIAIVDTGIDYLHPDLQNNLFVNSLEDINHNGLLDEGDNNNIDDDGNGFVDDVIGWDFTDRIGFPFSASGGDYISWDNNPMDEFGHGTWVAGIIGAISNNIIGTSGLVPNTTIINIRAFDPTGNGEEDDAAAAILYAVQMGAKVINMSFGDTNFSLVLRDIIKFAYDNNVVLVASAGNSSSNQPHYPSSYPEVISVGATDENDYLASFSNYGSTIDLVAPGVNLWTTDINNSYKKFSGTSSSAPVVSSAAALLLSLNNYKPEEIRQILKSTTDDLGTTGWDERFGAGRLNLLNAVTLNAPAVIKINSPVQDFSTNADEIKVNASVLTGYFSSFSLKLGIGINPDSWTDLLSNETYQFAEKDIFALSTQDLPDSVYCLSLIVNLQNGKTLEERCNFYIDHSAPEVQLVHLSSAYYGAIPTVLGSIFTNELCSANMFYRIKGETEFHSISLDGFNTNNRFIKQFHFGFIPLPVTNPNTTYEVYFSATNLVGLETKLLNESSQYFEVKSKNVIYSTEINEKPYSLPLGRIYQNSVNLLNNNDKYILMNENSNSADLQIYKYEIASFNKVDSLKKRQIPKSASDFNGNNKIDLLSYFYPKATIDELNSTNSLSFNLKFADSSAIFRPILVDDIDNDLNKELLAFTNDTTLSIYKVNSDLSLSIEKKLFNFSSISNVLNYNNSFGSPNAVITNGVSGVDKKEIWTVDTEGDLICYYINGADSYSNGIYISTSYFGVKNILSAGDIDNDGQNELAVLLESSEDIDIAPFKLLLILNIKNNALNVLYDNIFIDPSLQFTSLGIKPKSNIKFAKLLADGSTTLAISSYPYSYVLKHDANGIKPIFFNENSDLGANELYYSIFTDDLDNNGIIDFTIPKDDKIQFVEFKNTSQADAPVNFKGYCVDNKTTLTWESNGQKTYIYRSVGSMDFTLIDSTSQNTYYDINLQSGINYKYYLKNFDINKTVKLSNNSSILSLTEHPRTKISSTSSITGKSVVINFSSFMNTSIMDLNSFIVNNSIYPSSISIKSNNSYILNFTPELKDGLHTLIIKNLLDSQNAPLLTDTLTITINNPSISNELFITNYQITSDKQVKIQFNMPVNEASVTNLNHYRFTPSNACVGAIIEPNSENKSIIITTKSPIKSTGVSQKLQLIDIYSDNSSGNVKINSGAGSFIVLTTHEDNLNQMYVYPNPYKADINTNYIHFAKLTAKAKIVIFDINGKKIAEISETDGNGGAMWNLMSLEGISVSSGIYIYRAASLDSNENEKEVKIGKFAIIR